MLVACYRLRRDGVKLPTPEVRHGRAQGALVYRVRLYHAQQRHHVMLAVLLAPDGERYVVPPLDHARVAQISGNGILISGVEVQAHRRASKNVRSDRHFQSWWCVPAALDTAPEPSPKAARLLAQMFGDEAL